MKKITYIICLIFLHYSCGTDSVASSETEIINNPTSANLIFPYASSLCNEGTNITATQSTVLFEWEMSANTDTYLLKLKNVSTGILTEHQTTDTQIPIVLDRATQYV